MTVKDLRNILSNLVYENKGDWEIEYYHTVFDSMEIETLREIPEKYTILIK